MARDNSAAMRMPAENVIVSPTRATECTIASWQRCRGGTTPLAPPEASPARISSRTRNIRNSA